MSMNDPDSTFPLRDSASPPDVGEMIQRAIDAELHQRIADLEARLAEANEKEREHEVSFDIRWNASMRAIERWQEATGKALVWPDHADLCVWLMEQLAAANDRALKSESACAALVESWWKVREFLGVSLMNGEGRIHGLTLIHQDQRKQLGDFIKEMNQAQPGADIADFVREVAQCDTHRLRGTNVLVRKLEAFKEKARELIGEKP